MAAIPILTTEAGFGRISRVLGLLGVAAVGWIFVVIYLTALVSGIVSEHGGP